MALLLLLLAISVKQDGTHLRSGCAPDEESLATLASGAQVAIRYAISGESTPCYKVSVESGGKTMDGYLSAAEIDGLDQFDQGRRDAARIEMREVIQAVKASAPIAGTPNAVAQQAMQLVDSGQPRRALQILEPETRRSKDPGLLAIAGVAAWKSDDSRRALEYWRASLELKSNPDLESLVHRVEREAKSDQSADKLIGMRVVLRYDGVAVKTDTARQMLATLDEEYFRISQQLGCFAEEKIVAIVQTQDAYRKTTNTAEWSGGQFDGRIRVPLLAGQEMDARVRRVFAHETVHACLAMLGQWPSWLHEGLAQKLSGETMHPSVRQKIDEMIRDHKLPRLENVGQDWSRLDSAHAAVAYGLSLEAVEMLYQSQVPIPTLLRNPDHLATVTADLDKRLGL
jgi:hypothetical protein